MSFLPRTLVCLTALLPVASPLFATEEPVIERSMLEQQLVHSPLAQSARSDVQVVEEQRQQRSAETGWRAFGALNAATLNEIEGEDNRRYDRLQGDIGLRHPLLGSQRAEQEAVLDLERLQLRTQGEADARIEQLAVDLRKRYADYWLNERLQQLSEDWLQTAEPELQRLSAQSGRTVLNSEIAALASTVDQARVDRQQAIATREAARRGMEALLGQSITAFQAVWPGSDAICRSEPDIRNAVWRQDPEIRALKAELAVLIEQGGYRFSDEINSNLTLTHSQILEEWDDRGHETSIGLTAEMPIAVAKAHDHRTAWRNAQILQLQRRLEVERQAAVAMIAGTIARLQATSAARTATENRLRRAHYTWVESQERTRASVNTNQLLPLAQSVNWYRTARERLQQEAEWLRARAELEGIRTPECPPSLATAPETAWLTPLPSITQPTESGQ